MRATTAMRRAWQVATQAATAWFDDRCASHGAAIAYYTLFSLAPLVLIAVSVAGLFFGTAAAQGELVAQLQRLIGQGGAQVVQDLLASVDWPAGSVLNTLLGLGLMLVGATTVLAEIQATLDVIWRAPPLSGRPSLWLLVRTRLLSFGMILGLGFLLVVSLLVNAALAALQKLWVPMLGGWVEWIDAVGTVVGLVLLSTIFTVLFKGMPRAPVAWRHAALGGMLTALLVSAGRGVIGYYVDHAAVVSGFGAAGSVVAMLVWVYYTAQVFLLGAEFTRAADATSPRPPSSAGLRIRTA